MHNVKTKFSNKCANLVRKLHRDESGQGMTEYIIIVALVAIMSIGFVSLFGNNIRALFGNASNALAGQESISTTNTKTTSDTGARTIKDWDKINAVP